MLVKNSLIFALAFNIAVNVWSQNSVTSPTSAPVPMVAKYVDRPVKMDGLMGDPAWSGATAYSLELANGAYDRLPQAMKESIGSTLREKGWVKLLWDKDFLYVGASLDDSDIVAEGKADQSHLYGFGDVLEVFLKPSKETYYWEFYGDPKQLKTCFFYPGRGHLWLPSCSEGKPDFTVNTSIDGTLNDWHDKDKGWTVEIAIPAKTLTQFGAHFDNATKWTILISRYNYSRYLPVKENSSTPQLSCSNANNHTYEDYAKLCLED